MKDEIKTICNIANLIVNEYNDSIQFSEDFYLEQNYEKFKIEEEERIKIEQEESEKKFQEEIKQREVERKQKKEEEEEEKNNKKKINVLK